MKKLFLIIFLFFCGMTTFAQNDYSIIKGNVAEKNVNISRKLKKKRIVNSRSIATTWQWEAGEQLVLSQD